MPNTTYSVPKKLGILIATEPPYHPRELLMRLQAVHRRMSFNHEDSSLPRKIYEIGDVIFNPSIREIKKDGKTTILTMHEYLLLTTLIACPHITLDRDQLSLINR
ncbi:MAG: response regulator transcription factor [Limnohabitans sp.]|nr:response regulator transcription factor [Limnohabitans sp.]